MKTLYLDNAALTRMRPKVKRAMDEVLAFGNPSAPHAMGRAAKALIDEARATIARLLNADEVVFTASGTESNNLALRGLALANRHKGNHIITTKIEHPSVLETCKYLEGHGFEVTYLDVDHLGVVSPDVLRNAIREDTVLVSIMWANNEVGTIQDIPELASIAHEKDVLFHTDACQALADVNIDCTRMGIDALTLNAAKIGGPGVGALLLKKGIQIEPIIYGGGQEKGLRAGTENVPGIVGMRTALQLLFDQPYREPLKKLREYTITEIQKRLPHARLQGHREHRLASSISMTFPGVLGETILEHLSAQGMYASMGSACSTNKHEPSHVLNAIGMSDEDAQSTLRFSLSPDLTMEDMEGFIVHLCSTVESLEIMSKLGGSHGND